MPGGKENGVKYITSALSETCTNGYYSASAMMELVNAVHGQNPVCVDHDPRPRASCNSNLAM